MVYPSEKRMCLLLFFTLCCTINISNALLKEWPKNSSLGGLSFALGMIMVESNVTGNGTRPELATEIVEISQEDVEISPDSVNAPSNTGDYNEMSNNETEQPLLAEIINDIKDSMKKEVDDERISIKNKMIFGHSDEKMETGIDVSCDVLILGAGMAGISAAKTLRELGITNIMVVEGADRIGGRVKDVDFGGVNVEVGANWVHFANMEEDSINLVDDIVVKEGLNTVEDEYEDLIFRFNGKNVTDESYEAFDRMEGALYGAIELGERKLKYQEPDVNFRVALALQDWRPITPVEQAVEYFNFDFEFGDEPSDTGLTDNFKIFAKHGKHDKFVADKRGYAHIIYKMADQLELQEKSNFFLNEYVTEIHYNEPGEHKVKVVSENTKENKINIFRAKYVIVTFSIGVLESDLVEFFPSLPAWKEEIIYMYKMTRYIKIFVKFPSNIKAFWDDNHYIMYVDPTIRGEYQMWQNLEARGKYYPKGTNMLLCTIIGENWERVHRLSKDAVKNELFQVLKSMYGDAAVEPEDILIPDWHTNPLFFGAYSNWPIGVSKNTYKNLDAPVGALYMAGEACSPNYSGYLHGAMESGELTARAMFACMTRNECEVVPETGYGYNETIPAK